MPLTSKVREYDPEWPQKYEEKRNRLVPIFGANLIQIDHVGSTAVPLLAAKPEIDILVAVSDTLVLDRYSEALADLGYRRGEALSDGHHFFRKGLNGVRTHKRHVIAGRASSSQGRSYNFPRSKNRRFGPVRAC